MTQPDDLAPGTIYPSLDQALRAASCLCGEAPSGATIYGTTAGPHVDPATGEAYRIAVACVRADGTTWEAPPPPYTPVYTVTRPEPR